MGHILRMRRRWTLFNISLITVSEISAILKKNDILYRSSKQADSCCVCLFTPKNQWLLHLFRENIAEKNATTCFWSGCFTPLPWRNSCAPRQSSLWADLVTLTWFGLLRHSWPLWLPVWLTLCCLFQQIRQHVWLSLIIKRYEMNNCFWSTAVCTSNTERCRWRKKKIS